VSSVMAAAQNIVSNFNVGVLGHVDSGKTSLAKALSTVASTACFDKNPQSRERGITLDLGFSSFCVALPSHLRSDSDAADAHVQFTLVDCPGHASLIRTVIGGHYFTEFAVVGYVLANGTLGIVTVMVSRVNRVSKVRVRVNVMVMC